MTGQLSSCRRFHVSGRVQGVYFRASAREQARQLGLCGWVKNLADGRVELIARGRPADLASFAAWLARGPDKAQVTGVASELLEFETPPGFEVR